MKLLSFSREYGQDVRVGIFAEGRIIDLVAAYRSLHNAEPPDWLMAMEKLLMGGEYALGFVRSVLDDALRVLGTDREASFAHSPEGVFYHPPIPNPSKILCITVNYKAHATELQAELPEEPYVFFKLPSTLIGHRWPIIVSKTSKQADHEIELAVVIGRTGKYVPRSAAYDYVAGYTIFNDVSFRDRRLHKSPRYRINWLHLKNMDTAAPAGPWIVTKDEIPDPQKLGLTVRVNELQQAGSTSDMIYSIPELIEYISNGVTLKPGDMIATGTPFGIGLGAGRWLQEGDVVRAEIERIGELMNPVKKEV